MRYHVLALSLLFLVASSACGGSLPPAARPAADPPEAQVAPPTEGSIARTRPVDCSDGEVNDERGPLPFSLSFVTANDGWVLASGWYDARISCPWVGRTRDGGATWGFVGVPSVIGLNDDLHGIVFLSQRDGFIYGQRLWVTRDGGHNWVADPLAHSVLALANADTSIWLIDRPRCVPEDPRNTKPEYRYSEEECPLRLLSSADAGKSWATVTIPTLHGLAYLARRDGADAWIASWDASRTPVLIATEDGGVSWQARALPPPFDHDPVTPVLASSPTLMWAGFAAGGAGYFMSKWVFASADGGRTWELRADALPPGGHEMGIGRLPFGGHAGRLEVASDDVVFLSGARSTLLGSFDGGVHWSDVIPFELGNPGDGGTGAVNFVDPLHGWALNQLGVFRTTDGGHNWTLARLPGARTPPP